MEDIIFYFLLIADIVFWCQEYVDSALTYSNNQMLEVTIIDFIDVKGRVFQSRYYSVVVMNSKKYLVRRRRLDKVGRSIKVFSVYTEHQYLKMPLCYRRDFELIYIDLIQFLWQIIMLPLLIYAIII